MVSRASEGHACGILRSRGAHLLNEAWICANESKLDSWQFAVEISVLREAGLTNTELRWMLATGVSTQGEELTRRTDAQRRFARVKSLVLGERHCLVLTQAGHEMITRHLEPVAPGPALASTESAPARAGRESKATMGAVIQPTTTETPYWDAALHDLWFGGRVIKRFTRPAPAQETILAVLQEEGWPAGVDDPLPTGRTSVDPKRRLHYTVRNLNRGQTPPMLHFFINGNGQLIRWKVIDHEGRNHRSAAR